MFSTGHPHEAEDPLEAEELARPKLKNKRRSWGISFHPFEAEEQKSHQVENHTTHAPLYRRRGHDGEGVSHDGSGVILKGHKRDLVPNKY